MNTRQFFQAIAILFQAVATLALVGASVASQAAAEVIAYDVASNYDNNAAYVGLNLGTGFGVWTLVSGAGTNTAGKGSGFQQEASANNTYVISRGITTPLAVGSTLSLTLQAAEAKKDGGGVSLLLFAAGAQAASLSYQNGDVTWQWNDGGGATSTGVNYVKSAVATVTFTRTSSPAGYEFSLSQSGQTTYTRSGTITSSPASSAIDSLRFTAKTTSNHKTTLTSNTLQVQSVPEPATLTMLAAVAVGGLLRAASPRGRTSLPAIAAEGTTAVAA